MPRIFVPALSAQTPVNSGCPRPPAGSIVEEPEDLRSQNGVLQAELTVSDAADANGAARYCYTDASGTGVPQSARQSWRSRHPPSEELPDGSQRRDSGSDIRTRRCTLELPIDPCTSGIMSPVSTNLHFHGLTIPPVCHQDDVMKTSVQPGDPPFEYRFRIPEDEPPGLYWYHPHIHGFANSSCSGEPPAH